MTTTAMFPTAESALAYRQAHELASTDAERRYLARRLAETGAPAKTRVEAPR